MLQFLQTLKMMNILFIYYKILGNIEYIFEKILNKKIMIWINFFSKIANKQYFCERKKFFFLF
jgi:hypothetical protein